MTGLQNKSRWTILDMVAAAIISSGLMLFVILAMLAAAGLPMGE